MNDACGFPELIQRHFFVTLEVLVIWGGKAVPDRSRECAILPYSST
jgi:hypothetical protein